MNKILPIIITAIIVGGACFYGGMKYQASKTPARLAGANFQKQMFSGQGGQQNGTAKRIGSTGGANIAAGEIIGKDAQSITVKSNDGSSKIVFFSDTTKIMKSAEGSSSDLVTGEQVTINGAANPDGSITAQTIQLRPATSTP